MQFKFVLALMLVVGVICALGSQLALAYDDCTGMSVYTYECYDCCNDLGKTQDPSIGECYCK